MTEAEYWQRRIDRLYDKHHANVKVKQIYRQAYRKLERNIIKLYNELQNTGELTTTQLYQYHRFLALRREIKKQCGQINTTLQDRVTYTLTQAYKATFGLAVELLDSDSTWGVQNERTVHAALKSEWSGVTYSKRIWNSTSDVARQVEAAVVDCVTRGTSKDVFVLQIKNTFNVGFNAADRIVRTELMHTINQGQVDTFFAEGIKKLRWCAEIDGRVCPRCSALNNRVFDIEDVVAGQMPVIQHPNCRCTLLPVRDDTWGWVLDEDKWAKYLQKNNIK